MATTENLINGDGTNLGPFSFTFKWLKVEDIKVSVGGVLKTAGTHYTLENLNYTTKIGGDVLFTAGNQPPSGTGNIRIFRDTAGDNLVSTFTAGSAIRASDLNSNFTQNLYTTQEVNNNTVKTDGTVPMVGNLNLNNKKITNLATPTQNSDAVTKAYADGLSFIASGVGDGNKGDITVSNSGTNWLINSDTIVNNDINSNAAIVDTKLAQITTANKVAISAIDIDGGTDIGADIVDGDLVVVDDGGGGTNRKSNVTRIPPYVFSKVTGDIGIASNGTASITGGVIVNADVNASAAIEGTKVAPNFGSQNIVTTGSASVGSLTATGNAQVASLNGGQLAGNRNRVINGDMRIDQRNSGNSQTFTAGAALAYSVDRWYGYSTGANVTGQRVQGATVGQFRYQFTGAASVTAIGFGQRIEQQNSADLAGTTATLSVDLANSVLTTVTWTAYYATTADTFGTLASPTRTQISTGTFTVNSTVTRYSTQISIPAAATTGVEIVFTVGAQTSGTWTIGNVQIESGSVATPFERRSLGNELLLCQRYYETSFVRCDGYTTTGNTVGGVAYYKATKRITPVIAYTFPQYINSSNMAEGSASNASALSTFVTCTTTGPVYSISPFSANAEM